MNYVFHEFYCMSCGKKNLDLPRKSSKMKEKFHRKRMYCFNCHKETNMIECKNYNDVERFKLDFSNGIFIEEAKLSEAYCMEV